MVWNSMRIAFSVMVAVMLSTSGIPHMPETDSPQGSEWKIYIVDSTNVGPFTSIDLDSSGNPHISYSEGSQRDLKYAKWTGSTWSIEAVDSTGSDGWWNSIVLDSNDNPHISYHDVVEDNLNRARKIGAIWSIETVDPAIGVGSSTSIAVDSGDKPHISYHDHINDDLKYANWTGTTWSIETVDTSGDVGGSSSIAINGSDYPHIAYHDHTNNNLKYTKWTGGSWDIETVDSTGDVGGHISMALDSNGNPQISYYDWTSGNLKYANWTGTTWSIETVETSGDVGMYNSIAVSTHGNPHISYYDFTKEDLKYARWNGSKWNIETVDSAGFVGGYTSIALDINDDPHISYYDFTNDDLKYATKGSLPGPENKPPLADAGSDQTVNEGDAVRFNGSGSYDPGSRKRAWVNKSNIPTPRLAAAGAVLNEELYVIGGGKWIGFDGLKDAVEKYDPRTDSWSNETPIFEPHSHMGAGIVNGKLYAIGGFAMGQNQTTNLEFDPTTHTWINKTPMPIARGDFGVAVLNEKIYVIGGSTFSDYCPTLSVVEEYDPATDTWTRKADMPNRRQGLAAAVYNNKIFAIGGHAYCRADPNNKSIVEVYDPTTDTWTSANPLLTGRSGLRAETLGDKIYAIGGWEHESVIPEVAPASNITEVYDPATDTWSSAEPMWETRAKFASGVVDGRIYVVAGHSAGIWAPFPDWSEEYGPTGELQYTWDFDSKIDSDGDGNFTNDVDATGPTPTHIYYDDGVYVVTLEVTDEEGLSDWDTTNITVLNVPPTPEWTSRSADGTILNPPYPEGKEILFEATVYDPGIYDTFTYDWDFGDGTILLDAGPSVYHTYGDNDTYIVVLTVTDDDGGVGIDDTPPLLTTNENPVVSVIMPFCIFTEGTYPCEPIGEFTDPGWLDTHSGVWDYGDGTYETAVIAEENNPPDATGRNITSHIYGDNGVYNISFTVMDDDGGIGSDWADAYVQNLPPSFTLTVPSSVNEGESFVLGITATDPGSDDIIIDIDWGDGTSETMTYYNNGIGPDPPNSGEGVYPFTVYVNLTYVYGDNGDFTIDVTVSDDDGDFVTETIVLEVLNLPPILALPRCCWPVNESEWAGLGFAATDPGSDDLTVSWTFELGSSGSETHFNDGMGPDPPMSPWGTFSFSISKSVSHRYGDNGHYNLTIVVEDDDGGVATATRTLNVTNLPPTVDIADSYTGDENSPVDFQVTAGDPGSDDLTFIWDWGDGTTETIVFYNDGLNPDPPKSPWGTFPFNVTRSISHIWGDNGNFTVTLMVIDDDGNVTVRRTTVFIDNVAPTIESIEYYLNASFSFRIAGEKWHNVEIYLYEDGQEIGYANITRYPGSPNDQMVAFGDVSIDFSSTYSAIAYYTPEDDPINGQIQGATPAWVIIQYQDGEERIHHTFNVNHQHTWTWEIEDFSPYFLGHNITFLATASDPGSDDLIFTWDWGDGNSTEHIYYNDGVGPDPYPSPDVNPISVTDQAECVYGTSGSYVVTLTVTDDDGGVASYSLNLTL